MSTTYFTQAIVLQTKPWQENDGRVIFYSRDFGKLDLVARGWQKFNSKLCGHLQPFNLVNLLVVQGQRQIYAAAASSLDCRLFLKNDLGKIQAAAYLSRNFNQLLKAQTADPQLFLILEQGLRLIDLTRAPAPWYEFLANAALLQILACLGYEPRLDLIDCSIDFIYPLALKTAPSAVIANLQIILQNDLWSAVKQVNRSAAAIKTANQTIAEMVKLVVD